MNQEILNALVEMVKQGGTLAVWGIFVYLLMGIIKIGTLGGLLWITIKCIATNWRGYLETKLSADKQALSVFSDKASTRLMRCLNSHQSEMTAILKDVENRLNNLEKTSKTSTKSHAK